VRHQSNSPPASLEALNAWLADPHPIRLDGPPPVRVRECYTDWDKLLVPAGKKLKRWTLRDLADWTEHWPPSRGRLFRPLDVWDNETAALWLRDLIPAHVEYGSDQPQEDLAEFRRRMARRRPLSVLRTLDDDDILNLTDRVMRERLRRDVMSIDVMMRVQAIRHAVLGLSSRAMTIDDVRREVYEYDDMRMEAIKDGLDDCYDRPHSWIPEWACDLFNAHNDLYDWPPGFSWRELCRSFSTQEGMTRVVPCF